MIIVVDLTGDYDTTIYDAARRAIASGCDPSHLIEIRRDGKLSMSGVIGELAKWQVKFRASGPCLVRYQGSPAAPLAAETSSEAITVPNRTFIPPGHDRMAYQ